MSSIFSVYLFLLELLDIHKNSQSYKVIGTRDRILYGHSFRNITGMLTMDQCFAKCLEDCKCLSFQICDRDKICQLCSLKNEESLQLGKRCTSFVFWKEQPLQTGTSDIRKSCLKDTNCCLTSQPCENGATCVPSDPTTFIHHNRFKCKCRPGYQGIYCEQPIRSCYGHKRNETKNGVYRIIDSNGNSFPVRCRFAAHWAWTLIQSFKNRSDLVENKTQSVHENDPDAVPYRLSHFRVVSIRQSSSKWRIQHGTWGDGCWDYTYLDINIHLKTCTSCKTRKYINTANNSVANGCHHNLCNNSARDIDNYGLFCCYNSTSNECPSKLFTRIFLGQRVPNT